MNHPDLLDHEAVYEGQQQAYYHDRDLRAWYPRGSHTRAQAHTRFWRETNEATWDVQWQRIRVRARHLKQNPHNPEGYVECAPDEPGATAVWRCETIASWGTMYTERFHTASAEIHLHYSQRYVLSL